MYSDSIKNLPENVARRIKDAISINEIWEQRHSQKVELYVKGIGEDGRPFVLVTTIRKSE